MLLDSIKIVSMKKPIIEFKNIDFSFEDKTILEDFDFRVEKGQNVVIYGKSGTGKSTLLNLILGFKIPAKGEIIVNSKELTPENISWIRSQIAYVDQDVMLGEGKTENVIRDYLAFKVNKHLSIDRNEIISTMKKFDLAIEILDKEISQLSGGERQRVALAIATLMDRPIMLLDEVTSALDKTSKELVIKNLTNHKNITLLVVTHDEEWFEIKNLRIFDFAKKKWKQ